jgi:predicted CDP-diglyceride synthetase/phosphatidate cytidylyltransferase
MTQNQNQNVKHISNFKTLFGIYNHVKINNFFFVVMKTSIHIIFKNIFVFLFFFKLIKINHFNMFNKPLSECQLSCSYTYESFMLSSGKMHECSSHREAK